MKVLQLALGNIIYLEDNTRLESSGGPRDARKAIAECVSEESSWHFKKQTQRQRGS